jgi:anti-anti-sigma factor
MVTRVRCQYDRPVRPPPPFRVGSHRLDGTLVVAPEGEIDIATAPLVRKAIDRHDGTVSQLVLDLRQVEFMDTSGLQIVVEQMRRQDAGVQEFAVVRGPDPVQRLLDMAGLTQTLRLLDAPEEAVAGAGGGP